MKSHKQKEGVLDSFVGRSGEGSPVVVIGFLTANFGLTAPVNFDRPISLEFFFFSNFFGTWKSQFCLGYWKIFLLEIWVLVPIAQNLKDQMQISITRRIFSPFAVSNLSRSRERERKRKEKAVDLVTVINWDPHKFSPNLNPAWIQKQALGCFQICHGTYIKFKLGFQSLLKLCIPNIFFLVGSSDYGL